MKRTTWTIRDVFLRFVAVFRSERLPGCVLRRSPGYPSFASRTRRLSAFERQRRTRFGFCNLKTRRAGTTIEPETLSRAVLSPGSRFDGLTRLESHDVLHRRMERTSQCAASLYAWCAFRDCTGSRFRYELALHLPGCDASGTSPEGATFVDGAHHFFATCRLATTCRAIMASDVGRGLRAATCR